MSEGDAKQPSHLRSFIAGGFGGTALVLVGHPLDTIKVGRRLFLRAAPAARLSSRKADALAATRRRRRV